MENLEKKENILNVPNALTLSRIIITFVCVYFIFAEFPIYYFIVAFMIGMLTDFFDGQIARRFNQKTEFGRQFDIVADRVLLVGTVIALVVKLSALGLLTDNHFWQLLFVMSREIISSPFIVLAFIFKTGIPEVRIVGKITTAMQAIAVPLLFLSIFYNVFIFSSYFAVITGTVGIISAFYYVIDMIELTNIKNKSDNFYRKKR